jgi:hypothetical protein
MAKSSISARRFSFQNERLCEGKTLIFAKL